MSAYTVRLGEQEYLIERLSDGSILLDGSLLDARMNPRGPGRFDLRIGENIYDIDIVRRESDGMVDLLLNGKSVRAQVDDEKSILLKKYSSGQTQRHHAAHIKAPMPGKIVTILVKPGDTVSAGQGIVILEAMKMENEIKAPTDGTVKAVHVKEQDAVEKNTVLIDIE